MVSKSFLPLEAFKTIVQNTPLVSIDLVVRNTHSEVLLGKRLSQPAKGFWFVPGGRILKDELFKQAFRRLVFEELGVHHEIDDSHFLGSFEHHYPDVSSGSDFSIHYIVLAFELNLDLNLDELPEEQHNDYKCFSVAELLESDTVHEHTKWYFQQEKYLK